jgi:membrane fusion protein (multidrug efflux system)
MSEHKVFSWLSGRTLKRTVFLVVIPLLAICVGLYLYAAGGRYVSTNNAYVKANVIIISPEVSGRVTSVLVANNQPVAADDVLLQLDSFPLEIALSRARAARRGGPNDLVYDPGLPSGRSVLLLLRGASLYVRAGWRRRRHVDRR